MSTRSLCTVFRVHYRTEFGDFITIRGSNQGLSWDVGHEATWGLTEDGEDVWELVIVSDAAVGNGDLIYFKPLINDEVWGKGVDYVVKPGQVIIIYPFFFTNNGSIYKTTFESQILESTRKLAVYLPPSYNENPFKRYPVILFQDGHNLFDAADSFCGDTWQIRETMDDLCCNGAIKECIVVGIYPLQREYEYLPTRGKGWNNTVAGGGGEKYLDALTQELRPRIDAQLRTADSYSIAGSSYGGFISLYAWLTRPKFFDACGAFSPSLTFDYGMLIDMIKRQLQQRPENHRLYMDCGSGRDIKDSVVEMADYLTRDPRLNNDQFLFVLGEGHHHSEKHWAIRTPRALAFMFSDPQRVQSSSK